MELGEIVVTEHPNEREMYKKKMPRAQNLLWRSGNWIHHGFGYLTGEMEEYGEWMKSKQKDVFGDIHITQVLPMKCASLSEAEQKQHGPSSFKLWPFNHLTLRKAISLRPLSITMAAGKIRHSPKMSFTFNQLQVISIMSHTAVPRITQQGWGITYLDQPLPLTRLWADDRELPPGKGRGS